MKKLLPLLVLFLLACQEANLNKGTASMTKQFDVFIENFSPSLGWGGLPSNSDFSAESFNKAHAAVVDQLKLLQAIDTSALSFDVQIDWKFAKSILVGRDLEQGQIQFWKKDPRRYMNFRSIANLIGRPGAPAEKLEELETRLKLIPKQLANGQKQLEVYVPRFQELGLFMAEGGRTLFNQEIPNFIKSAGTEADKLTEDAKKAKAALEKFIAFLEEDLPSLPVGDFAIGKPTYETMLKGKFLLEHDAESLWNFGWKEFRKTQAELTALAKKIDPNKTWQELIVDIKNEHPHRDSMIEAHQYWVDKSRDHILENDLLPIPWKEQVTVVPRAQYLRKTSYYGNFSRAKEADEAGIFQSKWMINPFEHQWDEAAKQQYLVEHDWGVIIVTAPHESYGGHHVHGLYQMHNPSKLRRENGISLFSEGWGLYNEQLMQETGFFPNERIHLRQLQLRLWRNARVIYDVGLHTKRLTYEEAIQLMEKEVGFLRWAAQLEIDAATSLPGYFIGYFLGMKEILAMRAAYKTKRGNAFSLKDFHVKLMKAGNMPTSLMREVLMKE